MPPIPTNIITGFLGVGKTTLIRHLLSHKPDNENWAILVNEFGEVGIDGALLREGGAEVKEIPGGCMCCVAGLPMQIGLAQLLRRQRFDRLLIEPTGLGHPLEVLKTLSDHFEGVIDLKACLTLIDPRHFVSDRHLSNDIFRQQLDVADVLVATKTDLAEQNHLLAMETKLWQLAERPLTTANNGELAQHWLNLPHDHHIALPDHAHHHHDNYPAATLPTPSEDQPIVGKYHQGQGYHSCGWAIHPSQVFSLATLFNWINGLTCDRLKAVVITDEGLVALNMAEGVVKMLELDECDDSRLEIIHSDALDGENLERELAACLIAE